MPRRPRKSRLTAQAGVVRSDSTSGAASRSSALTRRLLLATAAKIIAVVAAVGCSFVDDPADLPAESLEAEDPGCAPGRVLDFAFFTEFAPVSYGIEDADDPDGPVVHGGYEADLVDALETMEGSGLRFRRIPVSDWTDIWLLPTTGGADVAGGGISILESRTLDHRGDKVVRFTSGHIQYRQSLLVREGEVQRYASFDQLSGSDRVGASRNTTNEQRLLELTGITGPNGELVAGTRVHTADGAVTADGTDKYTITAAGATDNIKTRIRLEPASPAQPEVHYEFHESTAIDALAAGEIDAVVSEAIGNTEAAAAYRGGGVLSVSALDEAVELGGWTLRADNTELLACLNSRIDYLTDNRRIGFPEWHEDDQVFMERALERVP